VGRFQCHLSWSLRTGLVVADQHDHPAVGCCLGSDKLLDGHVRGDRRPLEVSEHDDADQVPHEYIVLRAVFAH